MAVIAWIVEGAWPACVDAARTHAPEGAEIVLLHVTGHEIPGIAHGAFAGLLGRGHPERDPGTRLEHLAAIAANQLLQAAADRLGRPCTRIERTGRVEQEVVVAAQGAELLIVARDGDRSRLGPKAWARPAASSSTTPPARYCLCGPNQRPDSAASPCRPRPRLRLRPRPRPEAMGARTEGTPASIPASRRDRASARHRRGRDAVPLRFPRARPATAADRDAVGQRRDAALRRARRLRPRGRAALIRQGPRPAHPGTSSTAAAPTAPTASGATVVQEGVRMPVRTMSSAALRLAGRSKGGGSSLIQRRTVVK